MRFFFCASIVPNGIEDGTENLEFLIFFSGDDVNLEQLGNNDGFCCLSLKKKKKKRPQKMNLLFTEVFGVPFISFCFTLIYSVEYSIGILLSSNRQYGYIL